jgi:hypothetical protein
MSASSSEPVTGADKHATLYVLSDGHGFVGAFLSASGAESVVRENPLIPFIVQKFPTQPGPVSTVWVVLYRDIDAVAFVSNSRDEAVRVQDVYGKVGLTYPDSIDHWEHPVGIVAAPAAERMKTLGRVHAMYAGPAEADALRQREEDDLKKLDRLMNPIPDGPIARLLQENELVTILDCVVPASAGGDEPPIAEEPLPDAEEPHIPDETPVATRVEAPVAADQ